MRLQFTLACTLRQRIWTSAFASRRRFSCQRPTQVGGDGVAAHPLKSGVAVEWRGPRWDRLAPSRETPVTLRAAGRTKVMARDPGFRARRPRRFWSGYVRRTSCGDRLFLAVQRVRRALRANLKRAAGPSLCGKAGPSDRSLTALSGRRRDQSRSWRSARPLAKDGPTPPSCSRGDPLLTALAWLPVSDSSNKRGGSRPRVGGYFVARRWRCSGARTRFPRNSALAGRRRA